MKRIMFVALLLLSSIFSFSQSGLDKYYYAVKYLQNNGYSIDRQEYGLLKEGQYYYYEKTFYEGYTYAIVALSIDEDVQDLDLYVYESDGSLHIKDADKKPAAGVDVSVSFTRKMTVKVVNYDSDTPTVPSNCKLIIASKRIY